MNLQDLPQDVNHSEYVFFPLKLNEINAKILNVGQAEGPGRN